MQRTTVQIAKMRMIDLAVGDEMNSDPDATKGWFVVEGMRRLPSGELNVTNESTKNSIIGEEYDIVGVQVPKVTGQAPR